MNPLPEHRALFGVDVIGSARNAGHHLNALQAATDTMMRVALTEAGIPHEQVTHWEPTGDGALITLPSSHLGALFDVSDRLENLAAQHNRWSKPDVRLRIAIHVGPVGDEPGYYEPKISHSRLLNAPVFKKLLERCLSERSDGSVNSGLIVSDDAYRNAFGGDHTRLVARADFASVAVRDKEFDQPAWVRVPGFEARTVAELAGTTPDVPKPAPTPGVHNVVNGNMSGVQAGTIHGGISFGPGSR